MKVGGAVDGIWQSSEGSASSTNAIDTPAIEEPTAALEADTRLLELMRGYRQAHALHLVVELGIAERLAAGARSAEELARATGTHAPSLARLLRALASLGVFSETAPGVFAHSPASELLLRDHPRTRVPSVLFLGAPYTLASWSALGHAVRSGASAFEHVHGVNKWRYNALHPEDGAVFDQVMAGARPGRTQALLHGYDFECSELVVDVGGGRGHLLAAVLERHPRLRGILYDLPEVTSAAPQLLAARGVLDRVSLESGSFFERVPSGDTYLLSDILHDWPDEHCRSILRACRAAVRPGGRLLILEYVLVPGATQPHVAWLDLQMLVEFGQGRQRSAGELRELFEASGFRLEFVRATSDADIVCAVAA